MNEDELRFSNFNILIIKQIFLFFKVLDHTPNDWGLDGFCYCYCYCCWSFWSSSLV